MIEGPHRRLNPLTGEWVLVSSGRTVRPWQGASGSPVIVEGRPQHDPTCYLCPRNTRANGVVNDDYPSTFVFTNDFAALRPGTGREITTDGLMISEGQEGTARVICFSPRHDLTMARMTEVEIGGVIDLWQSQLEELSEHRWTQIFENRGKEMGESNPHPHGQIWAGSLLPMQATAEDDKQERYFVDHGRALLDDYVAQEVGGERVVFENDHWLVVVPFWAVWPFETLLVPKRSSPRLTDLDASQHRLLAEALKRLLVKYDNLFEVPFPYSMGWHNAPSAGETEHWTVHAHFYPPLLRSASVRKFMVGYELLGEAQRDITPEEAAKRLRSLPDVHYRER